MIIIGIDPAASGPAGIAHIEFGTHEPRIAHTAVVTFPTRTPWEQRFDLFQDGFCREFRHADAIACEDAYLGKNAQTYGRLKELLGAVRWVAYWYKIPFIAVTETQQRGVLATIPRSLLEAATSHLPEAHRVHAWDAIAIAWYASGVLNGRRLVEGR